MLQNTRKSHIPHGSNYGGTVTASLKFDRHDRVDLWLVLQYASILELSNSVCRLISVGEPAGSRSLARMVIELYVDFVNLSNDDGYAGFLDVNTLMEWQKTFALAKDGNPYFAPLCDAPGFEDEVAEEAERLSGLRGEGFKKLQVKERFERADMADDYAGLYHWLCSDTHSSLRGLAMRHIKHEDGDFSIHILKDSTPDQELPVVSLLLKTMANSSEIIHERFGGGKADVEDVVARVQALE
ncbi:MAG: DUF5677 domain-containing protein [Pseudomonadota bacterium]